MFAVRLLSKNSHALRRVAHKTPLTGSLSVLHQLIVPGTPLVSQKFRYYAAQSNQDQNENEKVEEQKKEGQKLQEEAEQDGQPKERPGQERSLGGEDYLEPSGAWISSPYFIALFAVGVGLTGYGLYGLYSVMTMWPSEIRSDLRNGLRAKRKDDLDIAAQYLYRAWESAKTLPIQNFGDDPLLKITGIGIALGGVLEQNKKLEEAYKVYEDAFWYLRSFHLNLTPSTIDNRPELGVETLKALGPADKIRAVSLAYKLSELAQQLNKPSIHEEKWLVWSVEAILRAVLDSPPMAAAEVVSTVGPGTLGNGAGPNVRVLVEQLGLPAWTLQHDIAAPFEALGTFYANAGNISYALPLYLQAISILLPPTPHVASIEDRCRGAQIMGNVADLMTRTLDSKNPNQETIAQAEAWAKKGLDVVLAARKASAVQCDICEESFAVLLFNLAMIREVSGDTYRARALLRESLEQAKMIGMTEGIQHASDALKALDIGQTPTVAPQGQPQTWASSSGKSTIRPSNSDALKAIDIGQTPTLAPQGQPQTWASSSEK